MSTRGLIGFRYHETDKLAYNHADSDPDYLGRNILKELKAVPDWEQVKDRIRSLVPINEARPLGEHDGMAISEIRRHYPDSEYHGFPRDYYQLFRPLQGTLKPYLDGKLMFMPDAGDFIYDSLHCEWAYIANLDSEHFEVWKGLQRQPSTVCSYRYDQVPDRMGYFPCALAQQYSLDALPDEKTFLRDLKV